MWPLLMNFGVHLPVLAFGTEPFGLDGPTAAPLEFRDRVEPLLG